MKVKKIAALAVGAAMLGATIGFASAVHVPNEMPTKDFFVKNGQPNVKIVVGSQGAAQDVVAAADIAVALGTLLYNEKEVEVSGPVVFKELPHTVDKLPVYETPGRLVKDNLTDLENEAADYWWNGSNYSTTWDNYTGTWSEDLGAYEKILNKKADDWMAELDNTSYNADAYVQISAIKVVLGDNDALYPTGDEKIYIPKGAFNYTVDYEQFGTKTVSSSYTSCCVYHHAKKVHYLKDPGIQPGDSFTFLGQKYHAVCVYGNYSAGLDLATICPTCVAIKPEPYALLLASDAIEGQEGWVKVGSSITVGPNGEYTINVLDINMMGTERVLLKVVDNTGVRPSKPVPVSLGQAVSVWGDYNGDGADDLVIVLHNTFVGVNGANEAQLLVYTDLRPVNDGDHWPNGNWEVSFYGLVYNTTDGKWEEPNITGGGWNTDGIIALTADDGVGGKAVAMISVVNTKKIGPAKSISVPSFDPLYNLTYSANICGPTKCSDKSDDAYDKYVYSAEAWIDIVQVGHLATYEMKKGDTLHDAHIGPSYIQLSDLGKVKTVEPSKVTQPITMLDSEVMAKGLDKVGSNLILVGGPVVNSVTAALADKLGVPSDYNGWESQYGTGADSGVIQYVKECSAIGGYGVLLVAGTDRKGTMAAAEYLMDYLSKL